VSDGKAAANGASHTPDSALPVFYRQPRPLNATFDEKRSLKGASDFGFARGTNSLVLNGVEFPSRCAHTDRLHGERAARRGRGARPCDSENLFIAATAPGPKTATSPPMPAAIRSS